MKRAAKRPGPVHTAVLLAMAGAYLLAAFWPQGITPWLPGFTKSAGQWYFWPACIVIWLSVLWLVLAPRKSSTQLRWFQGLACLAFVALLFVDIGMAVAFLLLTAYASLAPRHPEQPSSSVPRH